MARGSRPTCSVPTTAGNFPAILNLGPYQKDKLWVPPANLEEKATPNMNWETVTPEWWVPKGYAAVRVDGRGSGKSPGQCEPWSLAEAIDFYDAIEWAAAQPWCNGNVGLSGISYFAINQWFVANLQPPSLKAIMPWEGFADIYRDALFHGGILNVLHDELDHRAHHASPAWAAPRSISRTAGRPTRCGTGCTTTSTAACWPARRRSGTRSRCRSTASATGPASACTCAATPKASCMRPRSTRSCACTPARTFIRSTPRRASSDQLRWFDYWLKGIDNGIMDEPPVKLAIRNGADKIEWRFEHEWPLKRTQWTKYYFDISTAADGKEPRVGALAKDKPAKSSRPAPIRRSISARWARPRRRRRR